MEQLGVVPVLMYTHEERRHVDASADRIFAILADVAHHDSLAASGEVKAIRMVSPGPLGVGSEWDADEEIKFGRGMQKFVARSTVRQFEAPRVFSWTSVPPGESAPRRIQWWYELTPEDGGTEVVERVEVDMSPMMNVLMRVPYHFMRGTTVADGMRRTLENLETKAKATP